jgi:hypothetical protein
MPTCQPALTLLTSVSIMVLHAVGKNVIRFQRREDHTRNYTSGDETDMHLRMVPSLLFMAGSSPFCAILSIQSFHPAIRMCGPHLVSKTLPKRFYQVGV